MRIKLPHIPYITNKIMLDIAHSSFVEIKDNIEKLNPCIKQILEDDLMNERKLDERVKELLEQQEEREKQEELIEKHQKKDTSWEEFKEEEEDFDR